MTVLIAYLITALIGLLYALGSRRTIVYINAPEDVISADEKWKMLRYHILIAIIAGIAFVNLLIKNYQPDLFEWIQDSNYLAYSIIISIIISFFLIAGIIQAYLINTNPSFAGIRHIKKNPDVLEPEEHYTTDRSLNENEFWDAVELVSFNESKLQFDYTKIRHEFTQRHPVWLLEFYHALIEQKIQLINKDILRPYSYIFRKYEEDFHNEFCEFIIMMGREKYHQIVEYLDNLRSLNLNILSIKKYNLTAELADIFAQKTGKLLVATKEFEDVSRHYHKSIPKNFVKDNLPKTYDKFK